MNPSQSRRRFLQTAALAVPSAALIGCHRTSTYAEPDAADAVGSLFLSAAEETFLAAATQRLIPGADAAGIVTFIDRQLTGPYGSAQTWYMRGPWQQGTEQQGYQSKLTPAQLYRAAIGNIETWCKRKHGKSFEQLSPDVQDSILRSMEKGDIDLPEVPAKSFFTMLLQNTKEGYLADPMYGGNRDFVGWKLIGFPGPRYNYLAQIEQYGKPYALPTVGLKGRG